MKSVFIVAQSPQFTPHLRQHFSSRDGTEGSEQFNIDRAGASILVDLSNDEVDRYDLTHDIEMPDGSPPPDFSAAPYCYLESQSEVAIAELAREMATSFPYSVWVLDSSGFVREASNIQPDQLRL